MSETSQSLRADFEQMKTRLADRYGDMGKGAADRLETWLFGNLPFTEPEILAQQLSEEHTDLVFDAFWQVLPFGTGGRRGRVGYGANRINAHTVAMTIQGHCNFLKQTYPDRTDLKVVIANDVRIFKDATGTYDFLPADHPLVGSSSRSFAKLACQVYAANGITAYIGSPDDDTTTLSTPELSYLVRTLGAVGGIVVSASHNPPDDNGVKLYDAAGGQPVAPQDQQLLDISKAVEKVELMSWEAARAAGKVLEIPPETHETYLAQYDKLYGDFVKPDPNRPVVYTPLCGVGGSTVGDVLPRLGFNVKSPAAEGPDGTFQVIPFKSPNPEVPQSTEPARAFADEVGAGIVLSTDPDADRIGIEVKLTDGSWYHFDGNQIATVLAYALLLDPEGPQRKGLVIETVVTTRILRAIVEKRGNQTSSTTCWLGSSTWLTSSNTSTNPEPTETSRPAPKTWSWRPKKATAS